LWGRCCDTLRSRRRRGRRERRWRRRWRWTRSRTVERTHRQTTGSSRGDGGLVGRRCGCAFARHARHSNGVAHDDTAASDARNGYIFHRDSHARVGELCHHGRLEVRLKTGAVRLDFFHRCVKRDLSSHNFDLRSRWWCRRVLARPAVFADNSWWLATRT